MFLPYFLTLCLSLSLVLVLVLVLSFSSSHPQTKQMHPNFSFQLKTNPSPLRHFKPQPISQKLRTNSNDPFASVTPRSIISRQIVLIDSYHKQSMPVRWTATNRNMSIVSLCVFAKATKNVNIAKISTWALPPPWAVHCCC